MMLYRYAPQGVCSREIIIEINEERIITNLSFVGGCNGNTQGVAALAKGRHIEEVIGRLDGIRCGIRKTSCPDQLAKALIAVREDLNGGNTAVNLDEYI